jgi:hypothetical protein
LESYGQLWMGFWFHRKIRDVPRGFCNTREDSKDVRKVVPRLSHGIWASRWSAVSKTRFLIPQMSYIPVYMRSIMVGHRYELCPVNILVGRYHEELCLVEPNVCELTLLPPLPCGWTECMDLHGTHDLYFRIIKYVLAGLFFKKYDAHNYCTCNQVA